MNKPNPASVFGRKHASHILESPVTPGKIDVPAFPAESEIATTESAMAIVVNHDLGNPELPIATYREQIVNAVDGSQATVITAETGAGKSTQVPQFLAEEGYEVIVTQPRVVAACSVAERVSEEVVAKRGEDFKDFVGYRTARERGDSVANQILFVTDGLQLVRELSGNGVGKKQALVLDEVHEWNENMEVLVAWAKQRMNEDPDFKVVVMSATMEAGPLANYFAEDKREVPVIEVPGRTFEVKKSEGGDVADQAIKMAREGKNTLVFVPGKAEIDRVMTEIRHANIPGATVLPLHGQLEAAEQRKVFAKYPGVKIVVATNVAQTSVTIEDIDAVVDSGLERTNEVRNGVEGLYLKPISQADCLQRAGRAGRTKEGEYVLAQLDNNPFISLKDREPYGTPEILRTRLDGMVLRLAKNGFDAATMEFYHSKDEHGRDIKPEIAAAKERLQKLGALREDDSITKIGRDMERMPVESHYARMMIEARKYGTEVQMQLAALLAVQEADGIIQFDTRNKPCMERWRELLAPGQNDSDMIKQLEVFVAAQSMSDSQKRDHDIYVKAISKAREVLRQLRSVERLQDQNLTMPTIEQREMLMRCIVSGMVDHLYISDWRSYRDSKGNERELSSRSMIRPEGMIVGVPFDLEINTRFGVRTLHLIESPSNIPSIDLLRDAAPQLFGEQLSGYVVGDDGMVYEQFEYIFNGHATGERVTRAAAECVERTEFLAREVINRFWNSISVQEVFGMIGDLERRSGEDIPAPSPALLEQILIAELPLNVSTLDQAEQYLPKFTIDDLVSRDEQERIRRASPDTLNGWRLRYERGVPWVDVWGVPEEDVLAIDASQFVLPDGRSIACRVGNWGPKASIAERQSLLIREREWRAQETRAKHDRDVQAVLRHLRAGYTDLRERLFDYSEDIHVEAERIYGDEVRAAEATRQQEEERLAAEQEQRRRERDSVLKVLNQLTTQVEKIIGRIKALDQLDEAPEDIRTAVIRIENEVNDVGRSLMLDKQRVERDYFVDMSDYNSTIRDIGNELQAHERQYREWLDLQRERESRPATQEELLALMNRFNNR